jgi:hypothetical protein
MTRLRAAGLVAGVALAIAPIVACGSGGGPLVTTTSDGRENPGPTRDAPPATRDSVGAQCIVCDVDYRCNVDGGLQSITLSSKDGTCVPALIDLICSGELFGAQSCSGGGAGGFTCGSVTCVPQQQQQPQPQPGGSGTPGQTGTADAG